MDTPQLKTKLLEGWDLTKVKEKLKDIPREEGLIQTLLNIFEVKEPQDFYIDYDIINDPDYIEDPWDYMDGFIDMLIYDLEEHIPGIEDALIHH